MTTSLVTSVISHADDASFKAWAKQLSDQLQAAGLVKTADTGQTDWNAFAGTRPSINSYPYYEVFRFPDSDPLQATRPVFLKISYGTGSNAVYPAITIAIGSGSNGSGTITGLTTTATSSRQSGLGTASSPSYCVFKPEDGFLAFIGWTGGVNATDITSPLAFIICRPTDDAGTALDESVVMYHLATTTWYMRTLNYLTNLAPANLLEYCMVTGAGPSPTTGVYLDETPVHRHYTATPRLRNVPDVLQYFVADIGAHAPFQVSVCGRLRTYMPTGRAISGAGYNGSNTGLAILWE